MPSPAPRLALPPHSNRSLSLAALLFGLMLVLLVLIVSWFLRAFVPINPLLNFTTSETRTLPAAYSPHDTLPAVRASLDKTAADGKKLIDELTSLQTELKSKVLLCAPIEPPKPPPLQADR